MTKKKIESPNSRMREKNSVQLMSSHQYPNMRLYTKTVSTISFSINLKDYANATGLRKY